MEREPDLETDGGEPTEMSPEELYTVVNAAVTDALLDVLATVVLLGLGLLFVAGGLQGIFESSDAISYVASGALLGFGLVLIAVALDLVPSFHEKLLG
ncbi:hypothetical protein [Natrarchaeobaculum aegyptiacum]|uniref:Uncharacterized protein n=1 Tax=Natrarchaeobaculum aegyptiacum TaxID=745377 RepID=A0A2Z2HRW8_9EURY|nr:hypothetical protein [Natrarchaeobaculum aegyptiacum]ARS89822.1 hypothetical protein B1756_08770 [Natrarchaeobaculum aegyptiacum]